MDCAGALRYRKYGFVAVQKQHACARRRLEFCLGHFVLLDIWGVLNGRLWWFRIFDETWDDIRDSLHVHWSGFELNFSDSAVRPFRRIHIWSFAGRKNGITHGLVAQARKLQSEGERNSIHKSNFVPRNVAICKRRVLVRPQLGSRGV